MIFNRDDWCWRLEDGRVWSTKVAGFIPEEDAIDWAVLNINAEEPVVPASPVDTKGKHSLEGLRAALIFYGCDLGELATNNERIITQITALEAKQSARMVRGAALGNEEDRTMLVAIDAQIATLRAQMD